MTRGKIVVEDDVWLGMNCTILSGVTIHRGAVIGAGSVVRHDVPPYAIYVGDKVIKYRFTEDMIDRLMKIDCNLLTDELIKEYRNILYTRIDNSFFETDLYKRISRK